MTTIAKKFVKETTLIDRINSILDEAETDTAATRVLDFVTRQRRERVATVEREQLAKYAEAFHAQQKIGPGTLNGMGHRDESRLPPLTPHREA